MGRRSERRDRSSGVAAYNDELTEARAHTAIHRRSIAKSPATPMLA